MKLTITNLGSESEAIRSPHADWANVLYAGTSFEVDHAEDDVLVVGVQPTALDRLEQLLHTQTQLVKRLIADIVGRKVKAREDGRTEQVSISVANHGAHDVRVVPGDGSPGAGGGTRQHADVHGARLPRAARARARGRPRRHAGLIAMVAPVHLVILGECASKANQRKLATVGPEDARRLLFIKSDKARNYERSALKQIPPLARVRLQGPVRVVLRIFYASERPDLDESVVLDVLQDRYAKNKHTGERVLVQAGVYRNDRQVHEKHVFWGLDRARPRAEIEIQALQAQQVGLALVSEEL